MERAIPPGVPFWNVCAIVRPTETASPPAADTYRLVCEEFEERYLGRTT